MRILLAIASQRARNDVSQGLEAKAHEVILSSARGEILLKEIEEAAPLHVVLVTQAALGGEWLKLLRQLRRRAPGLRVVVLLRPGAEQHWRRAMLAGAFEALPGSAEGEALLAALCRALASTSATPQGPHAAASRTQYVSERLEMPAGMEATPHRRHAP